MTIMHCLVLLSIGGVASGASIQKGSCIEDAVSMSFSAVEEPGEPLVCVEVKVGLLSRHCGGFVEEL